MHLKLISAVIPSIFLSVFPVFGQDQQLGRLTEARSLGSLKESELTLKPIAPWGPQPGGLDSKLKISRTSGYSLRMCLLVYGKSV